MRISDGSSDVCSSDLLGVDSVMAPMHRRKRAWWQLAKDLPKDKLAAMTEVHPLSEIFELAPKILAGPVRGRAVIDINARSDERRVGKEWGSTCRSRGAAVHLKKKSKQHLPIIN